MTSSAKQETVQSVRQHYVRRKYDAGTTIFAEGQESTSAFVLLSGDVTIFLGFKTPKQRIVTSLKRGEMFGVHALVAGEQRAASAVTVQGCEVLTISDEKLKHKLDDAGPFLRYWVNYLAKRISDLSSQ
jgi:CRP-like cAMP-binding protein